MTEEQTETTEKGVAPRVQISPHPLGGFQVQIRDVEGELHKTRIELQEASLLVSHMQALIGMMFQQMYMEAAMAAQQAQESGIVVPGAR